MKKIRLSDTDLELFDIEITPQDYLFFQRHKDAFKTMFKEQGKPFWTRFEITFRSFTVKHGMIKQMNIDSPKFQNIIDEAFIFIHEQFVAAKQNMAKTFIEDIARLAQNQDKFPELDSKSFAKDPFYTRDTRELFRNFFGMPDQKTSYLKVYILCPVYLRFGGSICRCLIRWVDAPILKDPDDSSYWTPPQSVTTETTVKPETKETIMCQLCIDESGEKYFREKIMGSKDGPVTLDYWTLGDPRFHDMLNPLFAPHLCPDDDWRDILTMDLFKDFFNYARYKYGPVSDRCSECHNLKKKRDNFITVCRATKKKKKKQNQEQEELVKDLKEVKETIDEMEMMGTNENVAQSKIEELLRDKPRVREALEEVDRKERLDKLHKAELATQGKGDKMTTKCCGKCCETFTPLSDHGPNTFLQTCKETNLVYQDQATKNTLFELPPGYDPDQPEPLICGMKKDGSLALDFKRNHCTASGFKVVKMQDKEHGLYEVNITATCNKTEAEQRELDKILNSKNPLVVNTLRMCPHFLRKHIPGLPEKFEWWEGFSFSIAVLNYEAEERSASCDNWTNFTLRVTGHQEMRIKRAMLLLLKYIARRKKRPSQGWSMDVDDVVQCLLPEKQRNIEDLRITIHRGFSWAERLTEHEEVSLSRHESEMNFRDALYGLEKGDAGTILGQQGGVKKMRNIVDTVADMELITKDLPRVNPTKLRKKLGRQLGELKKSDILWEQMLRNPDDFEFFFVAHVAKGEEFLDMGLRKFDVRHYMSNMNPAVQICPVCLIVDKPCSCHKAHYVTSAVYKFFDECTWYFDNMATNTSHLPKMKYTETNLKMDAKDLLLHTPLASKGGKLEMSELQTRCSEKGVKVDKAVIAELTQPPRKTMLSSVKDNQQRVDFKFRNKKAEQTVTVQVGAYLPEEDLDKAESKEPTKPKVGKPAVNMNDVKIDKMVDEYKKLSDKDAVKSEVNAADTEVNAANSKVNDADAKVNAANSEVNDADTKVNAADTNLNTANSEVNAAKTVRTAKSEVDLVMDDEFKNDPNLMKLEDEFHTLYNEAGQYHDKKLFEGLHGAKLIELVEAHRKLSHNKNSADSKVDSPPNSGSNAAKLEDNATKADAAMVKAGSNKLADQPASVQECISSKGGAKTAAGSGCTEKREAKVAMKIHAAPEKEDVELDSSQKPNQDISTATEGAQAEKSASDLLFEARLAESRKRLEKTRTEFFRHWNGKDDPNSVPCDAYVDSMGDSGHSDKHSKPTSKTRPKKGKKEIKIPLVSSKDVDGTGAAKGGNTIISDTPVQQTLVTKDSNEVMYQYLNDVFAAQDAAKVQKSIEDFELERANAALKKSSGKDKKGLGVDVMGKHAGHNGSGDASEVEYVMVQTGSCTLGLRVEHGTAAECQNRGMNMKQIGDQLVIQTQNNVTSAKMEMSSSANASGKSKSKKKRATSIEEVKIVGNKDKADKGKTTQDKADKGKTTPEDKGNAKSSPGKRICGNCQKLEPERKAFKKCQKCKDEGVLKVRYYCSRDCQMDDWKQRHKMEHKDGLLG